MKVGIYRKLNELIKHLPGKWRLPIYRKLGMSIGEETVISTGLLMDNPDRIRIGRNCFLNQNIHLYTGAGDEAITIGNRAWIGMDTTILCPTHHLGGPEQRAGRPVYRPVSIGDGCWVGARVTVLPGVTIREGTVIAAGSVVAHDCKPNCLYAGSPAKYIRHLDAAGDIHSCL